MSKKDASSDRRQFLKSSLIAGASIGGAMGAQPVFAQNMEGSFL